MNDVLTRLQPGVPMPSPQSAVDDPAGWDADAAVELLYAAHHTEMVRLAVLLVRDVPTAEDVVQDAYVALHRRWDRLQDRARAVGYLRTSVVNGSRSVLRRRAVAARHAPQPPPPGPGADEGALATDRRRAVLNALQGLPRRQREVLALRHYVDLSERDIATTLGISQGAVKSHASRGAARLRELLEDQR